MLVSVQSPAMNLPAMSRPGACVRHAAMIVTVRDGAVIDVTALRLMTPRSPLVSGASPFIPGHSP